MTGPDLREAVARKAVSHEAACHYADTSEDPEAVMLRDAWNRLQGPTPDLFGAEVSLHGARLAQAYRALALIPSDRDGETERGIRVGLAIDYCRIASKAADLSAAQAIALAALDVLSLPVAELEPDTAAAFENVPPTPDPQPGDT